MATYTSNYNLEKPDASDPFGDFRESYNDNLDIIDANLGGGGGDTVSYTQTLATGTKVGEISINGTSRDINSPIYKIKMQNIALRPYLTLYSEDTGSGISIPTRDFASLVSWTPNQANGDHIGDLVIDDTGYVLYSKPYTSGEGVNVTTDGAGNGVVSLEYLTVVDGAVNLVFDDGN